MNAREMGSRGGRSRSRRKQAASRRNGKRGGRPRKADVFALQLLAEQLALQPLVPQIDPHDLNLILGLMQRPPSQRLYFIYPRADGGFDF